MKVLLLSLSLFFSINALAQTQDTLIVADVHKIGATTITYKIEKNNIFHLTLYIDWERSPKGFRGSFNTLKEAFMKMEEFFTLIKMKKA